MNRIATVNDTRIVSSVHESILTIFPLAEKNACNNCIMHDFSTRVTPSVGSPITHMLFTKAFSGQRCQGPVKQASKMAETNAKANISPAPAKFRSKVWKYFGFKIDRDGKTMNDVAVCKTCFFESHYTGNTTNMAVHMRRHHKVNWPRHRKTRSKSKFKPPSLTCWINDVLFYYLLSNYDVQMDKSSQVITVD